MNKQNGNRLIDTEGTGGCQRGGGVGALGKRGEGSKNQKLVATE